MGKKKVLTAILAIIVLIAPILNACVDTGGPAEVIPEEVTEKGPTIVSVVPAANARDVSLTTTIKVVFDKPMYNSEVAHQAFNFSPQVSTDNLQSNWLDNTTLEIGNLSLELDTRYTITLQSTELGELKDSEGNYAETGYSWSFTTTARPVFDLPDAIEQGLITAKFQGWSRSVVIIELANLTGSEMEISVPKGLVLQSSIADEANMVLEDVRGVISSISRGYLSTINYSLTSKIVLDPAEEKKYLLSVYSLESQKNNPGYNTMLSIGEVDPNMQNILGTLEVLPSGTALPDDSVQTAIWVYTDDISRTELDDLLTLREKYILNARTILQEAGVDTSSKRLFAQGISILTVRMKENLEDDRLLIYVNEVREANKISYNSPGAGNKYLILDIVMKNKTGSPISLDPNDFDLVTANNYMYWSTYKTRNLEYPFGKVENLPSGDIYRGEIAFEIPIGAEKSLWYDDGTSEGRVELIPSPKPDSMPVSGHKPADKIGDKVAAADIAITVNSKRMASVIGDSQAKDGWQFLILDITVENISSEKESYYAFHFFVQDKRGYLFEKHYASAFESGDLEPGESYQAEMVFEVPQASTAFEMWYSSHRVFMGIEL